MKCWVCKQKVNRVSRVSYLMMLPNGEPLKSKTRDVCGDCYPKLKFNACHFVEVKRL